MESVPPPPPPITVSSKKQKAVQFGSVALIIVAFVALVLGGIAIAQSLRTQDEQESATSLSLPVREAYAPGSSVVPSIQDGVYGWVTTDATRVIPDRLGAPSSCMLQTPRLVVTVGQSATTLRPHLLTSHLSPTDKISSLSAPVDLSVFGYGLGNVAVAPLSGGGGGEVSHFLVIGSSSSPTTGGLATVFTADVSTSADDSQIFLTAVTSTAIGVLTAEFVDCSLAADDSGFGVVLAALADVAPATPQMQRLVWDPATESLAKSAVVTPTLTAVSAVQVTPLASSAVAAVVFTNPVSHLSQVSSWSLPTTLSSPPEEQLAPTTLSPNCYALRLLAVPESGGRVLLTGVDIATQAAMYQVLQLQAGDTELKMLAGPEEGPHTLLPLQSVATLSTVGVHTCLGCTDGHAAVLITTSSPNEAPPQLLSIDVRSSVVDADSRAFAFTTLLTPWMRSAVVPGFVQLSFIHSLGGKSKWRLILLLLPVGGTSSQIQILDQSAAWPLVTVSSVRSSALDTSQQRHHLTRTILRMSSAGDGAGMLEPSQENAPGTNTGRITLNEDSTVFFAI